MPVVSDSYMGLFMPPDITNRISQFIAGKLDFPYVRREEVIGAFYLYGREFGVDESEVADAEGMAKKSVEQFARDVRLYTSSPAKLDPEFTRENYTKRSLQIAVDAGTGGDSAPRVAADPAILSDCFAQHVAHHRQEYYFELFRPFKASQIPGSLHPKLESRMLLLGFNAKRDSLPFKSVLQPFVEWMQKQA
ncbi:MAG TPA: hypothetical protein VJL54_04075 [Nitrososphaera sp.]|nr:hypothetical protein [Nitrososphaera sp.]